MAGADRYRRDIDLPAVERERGLGSYAQGGVGDQGAIRVLIREPPLERLGDLATARRAGAGGADMQAQPEARRLDAADGVVERRCAGAPVAEDVQEVRSAVVGILRPMSRSTGDAERRQLLPLRPPRPSAPTRRCCALAPRARRSPAARRGGDRDRRWQSARECSPALPPASGRTTDPASREHAGRARATTGRESRTSGLTPALAGRGCEPLG